MTYALQIPQHLPSIVGINEAHILSQLRHLINLGKDDGLSVDDDGRSWLAKRYSAWAKIFNWLSEDRIGRLFNKLKRLGYLDIRQRRATNCFALTASGTALFDDYTPPKLPETETRCFTDPQSPSHVKSPSQTRRNTVPDSANHRPFSIYNINNLIKDSNNQGDSITKENDDLLPPTTPFSRHYEPPAHPSANQCPPGKTSTYKDWWLSCQGQLELQLNRATYDTWLADTKFYSFEDEQLTLYCRNSYSANVISTRFAQSIMKTYSGMTRVSVNSLRLITHGHPATTVQRHQPNPPTPTPPPHVKLKPALVS